MSEFKECPYCHKSAARELQFCPGCGAVLPAEDGREHQTGEPEEENPAPPRIIVAEFPKSLGLGLLLTFIFGPLGMFYCSICGAIVMCLVAAVMLFLTFGLGLLLVWPVCLVWTYLAVKRYNKKILTGREL